MQNATFDKLEFSNIKSQLASYALGENAKKKCKSLHPWLSEDKCRQQMKQTTGARQILDAQGNPPITAMQDMDEILTLCHAGAMLIPTQLTQVAQFLVACTRVKNYLEKAVDTNESIAGYGGSFYLLPQLGGEINRCIRAEGVDNGASPALGAIRRKIEHLGEQVRSQLASLVQSKKQWLSDTGAVQRNNRYVLPVRREHKSKINGLVVDVSASGGTVFIEPAVVTKLQQQLAELQIEEDNEIRKVLYTLSALVDEQSSFIRINMEAMETLDFLFAKAKLSAAMGAGPVEITSERRMVLEQARHPLLPKENAVPLTLRMDDKMHGVVITGPNTGGKTVALKTVGLISLMAQCGLHITADATSIICLYNNYLCDLGDGQSISENLSTFSSHMTTVIDVLAKAGKESLVLLDELGSGTDPAEGMGIAIAVLEALRKTGCMLVATTHYPEVKEYAEQAAGYSNARMAFNRETLQPTYRLEIGKAGESCALYIARRLGLPEPVLKLAQQQAYRGNAAVNAGIAPVLLQEEGADKKTVGSGIGQEKIQRTQEPKAASAHAASFEFGDSVQVLPNRERGIVFCAANSRGEIGVQIKKEKRWILHKRLAIIAKAEKLYPPDYDFSVVFDTVDNRKARQKMEKGKHIPGNTIVYDDIGTQK